MATDFSPGVSPLPLHRQLGPVEGFLKRGRTLDDMDERMMLEEDEQCEEMTSHIDHNPEKRIRNNSYNGDSSRFTSGRQMDCSHQQKRARYSLMNQPSFSSHSGFSFDANARVLKLENEYRHQRQELLAKEEQLRIAEQENVSCRDQMKCLENRNSKLNDENKILKRAVSIQESRMKDLNQQNQQLQQILSQAAVRISQLENGQSNSCDIDFNVHKRPPDVF